MDRAQVTRSLALLAACVVAALGVTACGSDERTVTTSDLLGLSTVQAYTRMGVQPGGPTPVNLGIITYEMSPVITKKPSPEDPGGLTREWLTVVACYSDAPQRQLTLGVLPMSDSTPQIVATAKAHGYDRFVNECPGTGSVFTVPAPAPQ